MSVSPRLDDIGDGFHLRLFAGRDGAGQRVHHPGRQRPRARVVERMLESVEGEVDDPFDDGVGGTHHFAFVSGSNFARQSSPARTKPS